MIQSPMSAKELEDANKPAEPEKKENKAAEPKKPEAAKIVVGEKLEKLKDKCPAHWSIAPYEGDEILATCSTTGELFRGTVSEFNAALRAS